MTEFLQTLLQNLPVERYLAVVFLLMARLGPLVFVAPFLGGRKVPAFARMAAVGALGLALWPAAWAGAEQIPPAWALTAVLIVKEALVGTVLALMASVLFLAAESAGRLMDAARGAQMSEVLTVHSAETSSPLGALMLLVTVVLFMAVDGHHLVIEAVGRSYRVVPLAHYPSLAGLAGTAKLTIWLGARFFAIALGLAAPVLAVVFLTEMSLGLLGRLAPQMPSYFVALPLKGYVALLTFLVSLLLISYGLERVFASISRLVDLAARALGS